MSGYDHYDYRAHVEREDRQRRAERAAYRESLRAKAPDPESMPREESWQLGFLVRFIIQFAFWTTLIWILAGRPQLPIRWLQ